MGEDEAAGTLFGPVLSRGGAAAQVDDAAWLRAMLDVEAALAVAAARAGLVPAEAAARIGAACEDLAAYDVAALGRQAAAAGNPVVPLVRAIEARAGEAGEHVHLGATSQDVLDTAMSLVARRALRHVAADLLDAARAAARLAGQHRDTVMAGRTLLQQALPTTFGLKAAGWAVALAGARTRLDTVAGTLPAQLGGAAGTLSGYDGRGAEVVRGFAEELGLPAPLLPWHTARLPVADLAGALGTAAGVAGKVALDVVLLAQTEVGEVCEGTPGRGGSSAMPHKHNPVAAVSARAAARRAPALVASLLASMEQEHERAAGAWHAEWQPVSELLRTTGSAAAWLRDCLQELRVDTDRLARNLGTGAGELAAQPVAAALAPALGRGAAHDVVAAAVRSARDRGAPLREVLLAEPGVRAALDVGELDRLLAAGAGTGEAGRLVDAALQSLAPALREPAPRS